MVTAILMITILFATLVIMTLMLFIIFYFFSVIYFSFTDMMLLCWQQARSFTVWKFPPRNSF